MIAMELNGRRTAATCAQVTALCQRDPGRVFACIGDLSGRAIEGIREKGRDFQVRLAGRWQAFDPETDCIYTR